MSLSLVEAVAAKDLDAAKDAIDRGESLTLFDGLAKIETGLDVCYIKQYSILHIAVATNQIDIVKLLFAHGCPVNGGIDKICSTPLHFAVTFADETMIDLLLSHGADINSRGLGGQTPLQTACDNDDIRMTEHLLARGADVNRANYEGLTVLHRACIWNQIDLIPILLAHGASCDALDKYANTPKCYCNTNECQTIFMAGSGTKAAGLRPAQK